MAKNKAHAKALERLNRVSVDAREEMIERGSLPKPGQGPDESTYCSSAITFLEKITTHTNAYIEHSIIIRAQSTFEMKFLGYAEDGKTCVRGVVSGGDPGYDETAKMVSESIMLAM